jgi:peptidyl-prolyl cis-trans isomerase SurA
MKTIKLSLLFIIISMLFTVTALAQPKKAVQGSMVGMILAVIDDQPYTLADLEKYLSDYGIPYDKNILKDRALVKKYLTEMVSTKLIQKEAEAMRMEVGDEEVDAYIEEVKNQNGLDQKGFIALLKEKDLTFEQYKNQIRFEIVKARVLSQQVKKKVNIIDKDIDNYLEKNPGLKPEEDQIALEQILIRFQDFPEESPAQLREKLDKIRNEIQKGRNFREAGGSFYSSLGFVNPDDLKESLKEAVEDTELGQVSEIAETSTGLFILKPSSAFREDGSVNILTKEELENQLYREQYSEEAERYFTEVLPTRYNVEFKI